MPSCSGEGDNGNGTADYGGKEIFENNCVACHGYDGKAGVGGAVDLTKSGISEEEIKNVIEHGRNAMSSQSHACSSDAELQELIRYVISLREKK